MERLAVLSSTDDFGRDNEGLKTVLARFVCNIFAPSLTYRQARRRSILELVKLKSPAQISSLIFALGEICGGKR